MKTDDEIIARIEEIKTNDFFGFQTVDLAVRLPAEKAAPYLSEDTDYTTWVPAPRDRDSLLAEMLEYMPFAWDKANNGRGISAGRSLSHYMAWIWLAGDDLGDLTRYEFYGKDNLCKICKHYGWDSSQWDDGVRSNTSD